MDIQRRDRMSNLGSEVNSTEEVPVRYLLITIEMPCMFFLSFGWTFTLHVMSIKVSRNFANAQINLSPETVFLICLAYPMKHDRIFKIDSFGLMTCQMIQNKKLDASYQPIHTPLKGGCMHFTYTSLLLYCFAMERMHKA